MLAHKNRVNVALFSRILKKGVFVGSQHYTLRYIKSADIPRFSAVVSKKVAKLATQRNSIRRKTYVALRDCAPLPFIYGLLMAKNGVEKVSPQDLRADITLLLSKIK